jgi:hypothetical protein
MLLFPVPEKFNTFNTFNTFDPVASGPHRTELSAARRDGESVRKSGVEELRRTSLPVIRRLDDADLHRGAMETGGEVTAGESEHAQALDRRRDQ